MEGALAAGRSGRWAILTGGFFLASTCAAILSSCAGGSALTSSAGLFPRSISFTTAGVGPDQIDCQNPSNSGGLGAAGGPLASYVTAAGAGAELFGHCNLVAIRLHPSGPWQLHHIPMDLMSAVILSNGSILGVGFNPLGGTNRWSQISGPVGASRWTVAPLRGSPPATYDSLSCDGTGALCVAFPSALNLWAQTCPAPGMGQPRPPSIPARLPLFVYKPASGWSELRGVPPNVLVAGAAVTAQGTLLLAGQVGSRGVLLSSGDAGAKFHTLLSSDTPLAAVAASGNFATVVGGTLSCSAGVREPSDHQQAVYSSSDGGVKWRRTFYSKSAAYPLTGVAISGTGEALVAGGVTDQCGSTFLFCEQALLRLDGHGIPTPAHPAIAPILSFALSSSAGTVMVNGAALLLTSPNRGKTWQVQGAVTPPSLQAVQFFAAHPAQGVAEVDMGYGLSSLETRDGGRKWTQGPTPPPGGAATPVAWASLQVGYAISSTTPQRLLRTVDGGSHWTTTRWPGNGGSPVWLYFQNPDRGFAAIATGQDLEYVITTTDAGSSWHPLKPTDLTVPLQPADMSALSSGRTTELLRMHEWGWRAHENGGIAFTHTTRAPVDPSTIAIQPGGWVWAAGTLKWWYDPAAALWLGSARGSAHAYTELPFGLAPSEIGFSTHNRGWMVLNGQLFTTSTGGLHWLEVPIRVQGVGPYSVG